MEVQYLLQSLGYRPLISISYNETILSDVYTSDDFLVIVDRLSIFDIEFSYKHYCQKQNEYMKRFTRVYRFIEDDLDMANMFLLDQEHDYSDSKTIDRERILPDPSPLESTFETCYEKAFGQQAFNYITREYSFQMKNGDIGFIDFALFNKDKSWLAIEENGISYHHPYLIKRDKYRVVLNKQNSVIDSNGVVYRWDTESIKNLEKIVDEIREFIGPISKYIFQYTLHESRNFSFYEHQEKFISELSASEDRDAALVVLPTGTGKTKIAIEALRHFYENTEDKRTLILVLSLDLKKQWKKELISEFGVTYNIELHTYAKISNIYNFDDKDLYQYIIIDEAHHAVAPVLRKVLQHYNPKFLLGLTATDKRLDQKKLEDVFGKYETHLSLEEAIKKGILCPIRGYRLETNVDLTQVRFNGKDYNSSQLEKQIRVPSRNNLIADIVKEFFHDKLPNKHGIIFCINVAHAKEMAKLLNERGISAASVDGKDTKRYEKINDYMNFRTQFLCTCSLLTEGWDAPHTSVIVMARPTLSKVLYTQQLGRGTRRFPGKEALYVIDVVDQYGTFGTFSNRPWSLNALFDLSMYRPFGDIFKTGAATDELIILDTLYETVIKLDPFDIFTFEKLYGDYLSVEQLARELFVSTGTVNSWIKKKEILADIELPISRGTLSLFKPESISLIRTTKGLKEHTEETISEDFWDFIEKGDYTFSYKMYFILALLNTVDDTGDSDVNLLLESYREFYLERHSNNLTVDRTNSPYNNLDFLKDTKSLKANMLANPFEKFERKRFLYYNKDLSKVSIHHRLWDHLNENNNLEKLRNKIYEDLEVYYEHL